jgi:hypothetical protein
MKLNSGDKNEQGRNKSKQKVNAVKTEFCSFNNRFVNKIDQVLSPNQFSMKQNFAFH